MASIVEKKSMASRLNPNAMPWDPLLIKGSESDRSIFVTFSIGYPLDEQEIHMFFTRKYGECVEKVDLYQGDHDRCFHPLFGRVVFTKRRITWMVLENKEQVQFKVNGKNLWCKKYKKSDDGEGTTNATTTTN